MPEAEETHRYTWHLTVTRCPPDAPPVSTFYHHYPTAHEAVQAGRRLLDDEGLLPEFALVRPDAEFANLGGVGWPQRTRED